MAKKKPGQKELPEFLDVTCRERILGPKRDRETGQKEILEPGDDCELPYAQAIRLEQTGKVAIDPDDRKAAKKQAGIREKALEDADQTERRRLQELDDRIAEKDAAKDKGKKGKGS